MARVDDDRLPAWRRYVRFWRPNAGGDVRDELEFHLESTIEELVAGGMSREAARGAARRKFGDVERISQTLHTLSRQRERQMARTEWFDTTKQDLVYGARQLRKSPAFTLVAVLTLALGIGANSAIFSVVYSVLLQPLPYAQSDRILHLAERNGAGTMWLPFGNYDTWRRENTGFAAIGAIWGGGPWTLTGHGDPLPIPGWWASAEYWKAMFIPPALGRYYTEAEDREGAPNVVVLSYALWQNRFNGDRGVLGRVITLNGNPYTVVGVAPPQYILEPPAERIWVPLAPPGWRLADFADHELSVFGLLKPDVSAAAAVRQLTQIEMPLARQHPHSAYDGGVVPTWLVDRIAGPHRSTLYMLLGAVVLVLLIACGNIANLLLARANVRRTEIAIRGALGATRGRIVAQMLVESLLLAIGGGALGLVVAAAGTRFLVSTPAQIPRLQSATLNAPVVVFAVALAIVCSLIFGLAPAFRAAQLDVQQTLRDGGRGSRAAGREPLRRALVVSELCVAQILLIGAGLLIRSSILLQGVPVGFNTHNLLAIDLYLPDVRYSKQARVDATFQQIENAISAIPGVQAVGRTQVAPIHGTGWSWTVFREGSNAHDDGAVGSDIRFVSPGYFAALGLPVLRGRAFTRADVTGAPGVAIVSRGLAKQLWGDADPIGKRVADGGGKSPAWKEVVGVVDDMRADGLRDDPPKELYWSSAQRVNPSQTILVRGGLSVTALLPAIRRAIGDIDPMLALSNVSTIDDSIDTQLAMSRFTTWLLTLLGVTGLVLAAVGVYGVITYVVAQRTHEFGVRMALGSSGAALQWLVVRQGLNVALVGVVLGAAISFGAARVMQAMVFGITAHDPITFVAVSGLLALVAVGASYLPARRATRIDPLEALRSS